MTKNWIPIPSTRDGNDIEFKLDNKNYGLLYFW